MHDDTPFPDNVDDDFLRMLQINGFGGNRQAVEWVVIPGVWVGTHTTGMEKLFFCQADEDLGIRSGEDPYEIVQIVIVEVSTEQLIL